MSTQFKDRNFAINKSNLYWYSVITYTIGHEAQKYHFGLNIAADTNLTQITQVMMLVF